MQSPFSVVEKQQFEEFDWHESKQIANLGRHKIDFDDAIRLFEAPHILRRSDRHGEKRFLAVGPVDDRIVGYYLHPCMSSYLSQAGA